MEDNTKNVLFMEPSRADRGVECVGKESQCLGKVDTGACCQDTLSSCDDSELEQIVESVSRPVKVVRAPRYFRFMFAAGCVSIAVAFIVTVILPDSDFGMGHIFGLVALICLVAGIGVGGVVVLLVERAAGKHARDAVAQRETIRR